MWATFIGYYYMGIVLPIHSSHLIRGDIHSQETSHVRSTCSPEEHSSMLIAGHHEVAIRSERYAPYHAGVTCQRRQQPAAGHFPHSCCTIP